jgi:hypothetical protein
VFVRERRAPARIRQAEEELDIEGFDRHARA